MSTTTTKIDLTTAITADLAKFESPTRAHNKLTELRAAGDECGDFYEVAKAVDNQWRYWIIIFREAPGFTQILREDGDWDGGKLCVGGDTGTYWEPGELVGGRFRLNPDRCRAGRFTWQPGQIRPLSIPNGTVVRYHGSVESAHGLYQYAGVCDCRDCEGTPELRYELRAAWKLGSPTNGRDLLHVRRESFTITSENGDSHAA